MDICSEDMIYLRYNYQKMKNSIRCPCGGSAPYRSGLCFNSHPIEGWKCQRCKEVYYNPIQAERILILNKLQKMRYKVKLGKIRSNLIIRIPRDVGIALNLSSGDEVSLGLQGDNQIVVKA